MKLRKKDWVMVAVVVAAVAFFGYAIWRQRENFESKEQVDAVVNRYQAREGDIRQIFRTVRPDLEGNAGQRLALGLWAVIGLGKPTGSELEVEESEVDRILSGAAYPSEIDGAIRKFMTVTARPNEETDPKFQNAIRVYSEMARMWYGMLTRGDCSFADNAETCNQQLSMKGIPMGILSADEKEAIKKAAKLIVKVKPSGAPAAAAPAPGPAPSAPMNSAMSAGAYAASCNKCTVMNNQITCACDVVPQK